MIMRGQPRPIAPKSRSAPTVVTSVPTQSTAYPAASRARPALINGTELATIAAPGKSTKLAHQRCCPANALAATTPPRASPLATSQLACGAAPIGLASTVIGSPPRAAYHHCAATDGDRPSG
jgi:hypothetical protein